MRLISDARGPAWGRAEDLGRKVEDGEVIRLESGEVYREEQVK